MYLTAIRHSSVDMGELQLTEKIVCFFHRGICSSFLLGINVWTGGGSLLMLLPLKGAVQELWLKSVSELAYFSPPLQTLAPRSNSVSPLPSVHLWINRPEFMVSMQIFVYSNLYVTERLKQCVGDSSGIFHTASQTTKMCLCLTTFTLLSEE